MKDNVIYARTVTGRPEEDWETLREHSLRVADAAAARGDVFGSRDAACLLGLAHDLGKQKPEFQARLRDPSIEVSHSGEGARMLSERLGPIGQLLAPAILGHHGRMPDNDRARRRIAEAAPIDPPDWFDAGNIALPDRLIERGISDGDTYFRLQFWVRMLYSCLTDADDREAAGFQADVMGIPVPIRRHTLETRDSDAFSDHMARLSGAGPVNMLRQQVLQHVLKVSLKKPGLFTLTVPTGGGKTLSSLGFGLRHAQSHDLRRIIYVVPFTSVVEQTADVFRGVLGEGAVLEHHATADWDREDESEAEQLRIAGQSWDVPVIVTTAVQFFESLFSARKKRCRKLQALAGSVIIIDEAQAMPLPFLRPCLKALRELMEGYGATIVLSTATQPALTLEGGFPAPEALTGARELAPAPRDLYNRLRRVRVRHIGDKTDDDLGDALRKSDKILLIVDNRVQAREIHQRISDCPGAVHLSTFMTSQHRKAVLAQVRMDLAIGRPVRLVSTSLIEAGVDIDFPVVMRAEAGIDAIAQAAGRCNREGRLGVAGLVQVFRSERPAPHAIAHAAAIGREVFAAYPEDPISLPAVDAYFKGLWRDLGPDALDRALVGTDPPTRGVLAAIARGGIAQPYTSIDQAFRIIEDTQRTVIIRGGDWGVSKSSLATLIGQPPGRIATALQAFAVSIPESDVNLLQEEGALNVWQEERYGDQFLMVDAASHYDGSVGFLQRRREVTERG